MAKSEMKRVRVSVPANDAAVLAWLDAQVNVSASVRELIRREVRSSGVGDVFASDVPDEGAPRRKRRQGRPAGTRNGDYATAAPEPAVQYVPVQQPAFQPQPQPAAQPAPMPKAARSKRKAPARTGGGIQLLSDSLGEFGVELDIEEDAGDGGVQNAADALDEISKMMDA